MKITFLVNDAADIQPTQTTAMLIQAAVRQGHQVGVTGVSDLACAPDGSPTAQIRWLTQMALSLSALMQTIAKTPPCREPLSESELLFMRTNPARDSSQAPLHSLAIHLARRCQEAGTRVINRPDGLWRAANKLYLLELPEFTRPKTLVSQNPVEILSFIHSLEDAAVIKPLQGTRGSDVFLIKERADANLNQIVEVVLRQGPAMVQRCIPGAAAGDTRVVVFNGQVLTLNGHLAAIQRVPKKGDFRSNLHAGGAAQPGVVTPPMQAVIDAIGPQLVRDGLLFVGLDFIGAQLVEINVFSTGGLRDAERFTGESFTDFVMQQLSHSSALSTI